MNVMKTMMKWPLLIILMVMMMIITIDGWRNVERSTTPAIQPCDIGNWPHLHHHHHHNVDIQDQPYHVKVVFFFFHKSNHKTHLKIEEAQYILHQYKKNKLQKLELAQGETGEAEEDWRRLKLISLRSFQTVMIGLREQKLFLKKLWKGFKSWNY